MEGRVVYPVTRDVILLTDELWIERPKLNCYLRASNTGVFEEISASVSAYISSALVKQSTVDLYVQSFEGLNESTLSCFISSPLLFASAMCYLDASALFKESLKQFCFVAAAPNEFLTQLAFIRGRQDVSLEQLCYLTSNSIIQFVQQCYVS